MDNKRKIKNEREAVNDALGIKVDVDFQMMVEKEKRKIPVRSWVSTIVIFVDKFCVAHPGRLTENMCMCQKETSI
jgi:hypothetical protein